MFGQKLVDFVNKMEPSLHQNGIKNRCSLERMIFLKSCSGCSGGSIFQDLGVQVGSKQPIKHRSKNGVQDGMHLGIDFFMILLDLGCQVGRGNRSKICQKSHRKNDAKNKAVWDASWAVFGLSRGPRRTPTQYGATRRAGNPLPRAARAAALSRKNT